MRRITAARPSPHPRFLHNLSAILEQEEARFEKDVAHPISNSARTSYVIGRLASLIRENDDFFELLSSRLLVESRHSTAVKAGAARLLLACLSCGMYPDAFEDSVLSNIKQWVIEDTPKLTCDILGSKKFGLSKLKVAASPDWEVLKTYSLGLLAIALTTGGGIIEEVLGQGMAAKLMHFLRVRVLKESVTQKEVVQACENKSSSATLVKSRDNRVKFPVEVMQIDHTRDMEECSENPARGKFHNDVLERDGCFKDKEEGRDRTGLESFSEKINSTYDADDDTDWTGNETWRRRDKVGKIRHMDPHYARPTGRDDDLEGSGREEPLKWRSDARDKSNSKIRARRAGDGIMDGDKSAISPVSGSQFALEKPRGLKDRSFFKSNLESESSKSIDKVDILNESDPINLELQSDIIEKDVCAVVGGVDISVPVRQATTAAEAEAKAAKASFEAMKAAGEAAAELVKAAALEAFDLSLDKEAVLAAATNAAATVVDAAAATRGRDLGLTKQVAQENHDNSEEEAEMAELGDCVPGVEDLLKLRERYSVQCLERLGEYLEVLGPVLHERGVDVCLALLQRESLTSLSTKDASMLVDVLKLICALAAHRKFSALFVDRGGVQQILAVPKLSQTYTGVSLCLFAFASVQGVMERVCIAPVEVVNEVVGLALHLLEHAPDPARRNAALFFGAAFVFRVILDSFDAQDGLRKMLNLLRNAAAVRSGGGAGLPGLSPASRTDRAASTEVLTSSEKQIAYHTCVALRQYFRAHLLILIDSLRPLKGRSGLRSMTSGRAAYKPLDLCTEAMDALVMQVQRDRKLGPAFVKARWPALEKFMNYSGHITLLELTQVAPGERYLHDIAQHALGVLHIVTLMPSTRRAIVDSILSNERSGVAVILDAATATGYAEPEILQPALLVLVNLVCPPPSLSRCPVMPHSSASVSSQQQLTGSNSTKNACTEEGREHHGKREMAALKGADLAASGVNDLKESLPKGEAVSDKNGTGSLTENHLGSVSPVSAVVGDRRICLGSAAGGSGLAACIEQGYRHACDVVRANNGIKVLLHLLSPRPVLPPGSLDCIRALACRVLLGLARDDAIAHILTKLQVGKLLSELLREGSGHVGLIAHGTGDQGRWQTELGQVSMELIALVTNAGRATTLVASDAAAPTLRRIERAAIAAATPITYPARELLQLIHEHLVLSGMSNTASVLLKEAQLVPLPSAIPQGTAPSHYHRSDALEGIRQWPSGRIPKGFSVEAVARGSGAGSTIDQTPGSCRKKGPSFSSALMSSQKSLQLAPLSAKKDSKNRPSCRGSHEESEYERVEVTGGLAGKRKVTDSDLGSIKRLALTDCEGPSFTLSSPLGSRGSRAQNEGNLLVSPRRQGQQCASGMPEHLDVSCLQSDNLSCGDIHERSLSPTGGSNYLQNKMPHANLVSESPCQNERATLDSLVVQYLKHQHRQCPAPITTLPPLSLFHPHTCPEPSRVCYAPLNTARRFSVREAVPPFGGTQGRRRDRHFVYSRFRPLRPCRDERVLLTSSTFLGTTFCLAAASHAGEIRLFDCLSGNLLETHTCHQSPITSLQSASVEVSGGSVEFTGVLPGHLLLSSGNSDVRLWNSSALGGAAVHSFEGCKLARFNNSGSMFAAISTESAREVLLYDVQSGKLEQRLSDSSSSLVGVLRGNAHCVVHYNPSDSLLLWNGVLWDHRVPRAIHRFDQFTDYGGGGFHPAGNEVIINSEIWDLRFFKLLRSVPSLDQTVISFNSTGDVIYATMRRNIEDITSALHPRRSKHPLYTAFRTIDGVDYTDIATTSVDRCVLDLATEPNDYLMSVVGLDVHDEMDSVAKIYEVGRRKPTDDDSDPDDGAETDEDEDDFAEEAAEEEDFHGDDDDDSDADASNDEDGSGDEDEEEEDADAEGDADTNEEEDDDAIEVDGSIVELITDGEDDDNRISYSSGEDGSLDDFDDEYNDMLGSFL